LYRLSKYRTEKEQQLFHILQRKHFHHIHIHTGMHQQSLVTTPFEKTISIVLQLHFHKHWHLLDGISYIVT
jgi:hypothetical protein